MLNHRFIFRTGIMDSGEGSFAGKRGEVVGRALRGKLALLCDWALFIGKNPSLDRERFWHYTDEFGMLRFAQSMTRLSCRLLGGAFRSSSPWMRKRTNSWNRAFGTSPRPARAASPSPKGASASSPTSSTPGGATRSSTTQAPWE